MNEFLATKKKASPEFPDTRKKPTPLSQQRRRRTCKVCKHRFRIKRADTKYCCNACRQKAYRRRSWAKRSGMPAWVIRLFER